MMNYFKDNLLIICHIIGFIVFSFPLVYLNPREASVAVLLYIVLYYLSYKDLRDRIISNRVIVLIIGISFLDSLIYKDILLERIVFFILAAVILLILKIYVPLMMGGGDIKLICTSSLLLGSDFFKAYFIGIFLASLVSVILLILKKANRNTRIPLGPYLAIGIWYTYMNMRNGFILHSLI